jgi:phosphotriesterase-related protein
MTTIQSATGPLDTANLGFTLMHEHLRISWGGIDSQYPELFDRENELNRAVALLEDARRAGVQTIVDPAPIDLGRDVSLAAEASRRTGMQVIVATGFYYSDAIFYFRLRDDREMINLFVRDLTQGISTTGVRAAFIKCATEPVMHPTNERVLRNSARAARETGAPIITHTYPQNRTGLDQQRVFTEEGLDLGRTVIGHSDGSDDITYLEQIIENGSYCGMDRIGGQAPRTSEQRAAMIASLVEKGYAPRITLSHDRLCNFYWMPQRSLEELRATGQYTYIPRTFLPMLRERGVSDEAIHQMTVVNPRTFFEACQ